MATAAVTKGKLFSQVANILPFTGNKVTVVGIGKVGMAIAFSMLTQNVTNELCLIDTNEAKVMAEVLDLQHGSNFLKSPKITGGTSLKATANSKICIIAAGAKQKEGESRLDLVQRNTRILKNIVPDLIKYNKNTIILLVTNPVDIMTYVTWKLSGLPKHHVIGSGTNLDSSRFSFLMSQKLGVDPKSCHGCIIGEHGDSSVPVWSEANIAGVRLRDVDKNIGSEKDSDEWHDVHSKVVGSAGEIIKSKGYTSWAIGLSVSSLVSSILNNANVIVPVSTLVQGIYDINKEVFLSLPCVLNANGVTHILKQQLTPEERLKLHKSADLLASIQENLQI